jgi:hypothetical protein
MTGLSGLFEIKSNGEGGTPYFKLTITLLLKNINPKTTNTSHKRSLVNLLFSPSLANKEQFI